MERRQTVQDERGPSARNLVLVFLASVAVCAVFFSLGFLIGYNQRESKQIPVSENVPAASEVPPTVNSPDQSSASPAQSASAAGASNSPAPQAAPSTAKPQPVESQNPPAEPMPLAKPESRRSAKKSRSKPAPKPASEHGQPSAGFRAGYSVQVMAARAAKDANSLASLLKGHGYPAFVLSPQAIGANGDYFRVLIGPYSNRAAAEKIRRKLEKEGFKPFIKH